MLNVAITGATGEIGRSLLAALEQAPGVGRVNAMARHPFDPAAHGWRKVTYRRGDVLDADAVAELVAEADVVVHLAFIIRADQGESREINLIGSRNVFEAAAGAAATRLIYTSSVAAYGFHRSAPRLISEDLPARGSERHPYSAQKAEVERVLAEAVAGSDTDVYVFRPCVVAGPHARLLLLELVPLLAIGRRLPGPLRGLLGAVSLLRPVLPDPGVQFQLVHHDDVAAALCAAVLGEGVAGVYNLAGPGRLTISDLAHELGWHAVPVPRLALEAGAELVARAPLMPAQAYWIEALRHPVLIDSSRAHSELAWEPRHDALQTLQETVAAARSS